MKMVRLLLALCMALLASSALAQYPNRPLRLVVPFPPGGAVDVLGRAIALNAREVFGQNIIVDNRAGFGGAVGSELAAKSTPDGYTLLMGSTSTISINPVLFSKLAYKPTDFVPVTLVGFVPHLLVASMAVPAANLKEFIAYAKARPGELQYGSAGSGTPHHIALEMFKQMTGINMLHVPYKGTAPAIVDLLPGRVHCMSAEVLAVLPHVRAGKLRALGIATLTRNQVAPDIPTVSEAGVPGFEVTSWYGVLVPAGTPRAIVTQLSGGIAKSLGSPDMHQRFADLGATPVGNTPDEFGAFVKREGTKWAKAVKDSGAKVE
ncbi:MAG: tripartite tricarboxylate transporter substrate binding protein [Betaproteobacteria bacterium]|jgi:tripartite-type tricarboxylate transporter receptor subunit TctC|nr:tripartite tricarboxylate transporter substrate binding protein [Betaproteobacteria bacterium]